jgi:hypothetical protein
LGEGPFLRATRNIGQYITHLLPQGQVKSELADPSRQHGTGSGAGMTALTAITAVGIGVLQGQDEGRNTAQILSNASEASLAQREAASQQQSNSWRKIITEQPFTFDQGAAFSSIERLLGLL